MQRTLNGRKATCLAAVAALGFCAAPSGAAEAEVQLVGDQAAMAACERLGEVTSSSLLGGLLTGAGYKRAVAQLKRRAADLGGTHVHLLNANSNQAGSNMLGVVYRCPGPPADAPASAPVP